MQATVPLACFLSIIRPPGIQFENGLLQIAPVNKGKCPFVRDNIDVVFQLYTRHNPLQPHNLVIDDDERLFASSIDFNDPTVIHFHAFMETPDDGSGLLIREAFIHRGDTNLIMVDAHSLEAGPWYFKAAENTWYIGRTGARFIDYLVSRGLDLSKTHLVGHSLGAQSAGVAGSSIRSGRVARITGLDPALPLFNKLPIQQRLDPTDAEFVDVIHTDAGIFGYNQQIGHVDFYPNGGISPQPGCELEVTIPQHQLLNKSTGAPTCCTASRWCGRPPSAPRAAARGAPTRGDSALAGRLPTWAMVSISSENKTQTNGTFVYYLKPNAHPSKENQPAKINIRNIIGLVRSLNTIRNGVSILKDMSTKKKFETTINFQKFFKIHPIIKQNLNPKTKKNHRQRRFISFFKPQSNDNMVYKILGFLLKHHKKVIPVITVIREINTLIKTGDGEFNNYIKEQNNYIGTTPVLQPVSYNINVDGESKIKSILRKLFGLKQENLSITTI